MSLTVSPPPLDRIPPTEPRMPPRSEPAAVLPDEPSPTVPLPRSVERTSTSTTAAPAVPDEQSDDASRCPSAPSLLRPVPRLKTTPAPLEASPKTEGATAEPPRARRDRPAVDARRLRDWPRGQIATFALLLAATLGFYLVGLSANGYANSFYAAAAQAGSQSWSAFFFGASDAAGSITVDKPPASLWVMALSVRLFGLNSIAILLPQVLMGVGSVALLYRSVRRYAGHIGGMVAGAVLALTPVAVLMFRFNNPDALLTLLLIAAAWATLRAVEPADGAGSHPSGETSAGRTRSRLSHGRWLALAGVFLGLAFLTKTLQAFVILPALALVPLVAAPVPLRRRILHTCGAGLAMIVAGGWWVAIVELLPASARPYIGGSQTNSFLELTFGYNGLGRIDGNETGSVGGGNGWGAPGIARMFLGASGAHTAWFIVTALIFLAAGLWVLRRAPRTDVLRAAYLTWGGWLLLTGAVFSFMAGIYHDYYTIALAPGIAGLVGLGAGQAWAALHGPDPRAARLWSVVLALGAAAAAITGFVLLTRVAGVAYGPLRYVVLALGLGAAALLLFGDRLPTRAVPVVALAALVAGLGGPAAYAASTVATPHTGSIVTAGPAGVGGGFGPGAGGFRGGANRTAPGAGTPGGIAQGRNAPGRTAPGGMAQGGTAPGGAGGIAQGRNAPGRTAPGGMAQGGTAPGGAGGMAGLLNASTPNADVVAALRDDADSYRWVAATVGSQSAAGLQLGSGEPVMPIGGFNGSDPSPTLSQFQDYVDAGQIHYFTAGMGGAPGGPGGVGGAPGQAGPGSTGQGMGQGMGQGWPGQQATGRRDGRGADGTGAQITAWVQENFTAVTIGGQTFYDLTRPLTGNAASTTTANL